MPLGTLADTSYQRYAAGTAVIWWMIEGGAYYVERTSTPDARNRSPAARGNMVRREQRERIVLPVKVFSSNARGEPLSEMACVTEVSQNGARVEGVGCITRVNEIISLEHNGHRVQFRVVWIGESGTRMAGCAGLQTLAPQKAMFGIELSSPSLDSFDPTLPHGAPPGTTTGIIDRRVVERRQEQERRRHPRYKCAGSAEFRKQGTDLAGWGKVSDICLGGCYVEVTSPLPIDTPVEMVVNVCGEQARTRGLVRSHHPGFGMGIAFVETAPEQIETLEQIVAVLAGGAPARKPNVVAQPAGTRPPSPAAAAALEAIIKWFSTHETLSRQDFLRLIEQKKTDPAATTQR